ncbi:hypothetical protein [Agromyces salentinus]|uniref:WxL domain-containing protein n=1 Tax=Agromyces salentinus TaxID=269421 RepID=A0ABN2ME79_9MICO|nr:hypothetical protein [Agromyces salentinus]
MKSITKTAAARATAVTVGAMLLAVGAAAAANADESIGADSTVDVSVEVAPVTEPGVLAMSVAGSGVALTEGESGEPTVREFTGQLPTVTVTDTRTSDEIGDAAAWYVLGTTSDFVGDAGQEPIGAGHLGWRPNLIDGGDSGLVAVGDEVVTVIDAPTQGGNNVGLVDQELFASAWDSEDVAPDGAWTADADLFLRTPSDVAPGSYTSTLTLSLFE